MAPICTRRVIEIRNVWANNFENEFKSLLAIVHGSCSGTIMGLDVEFPGFFREEALWCSSNETQYQTLRANVDILFPIQIGVAVASGDGTMLSAWNFNLKFDADNDLHTESALVLLRQAGINFGHHAHHGIDASIFGCRLAGSSLVGSHDRTPLWVTLSGQYDFGYLMKVLTGQQLPFDNDAFQKRLGALCPRRHEIRDQCPFGSLDILARQSGVVRRGNAHTAGSDALTTLELYLALVPSPSCTSMSPPPGLSMPPPPGLSLPCPPGLSTSAVEVPCEFVDGECASGGDTFSKRDPCSALEDGLWSDNWRLLGGCEAVASACPLGDTSGNSWRHHARRAMTSGTAHGVRAPFLKTMQCVNRSEQCCWHTVSVA